MTPDQFLSVAEVLPEAMWLLSTTGEITAANVAAARVVGRAPQACRGMWLAALVVDTPAHVADYLRACSRTRALTLGALTFRHADGTAVACRAEGALAEPRTADTPALLLLRCKPKPAAAQPFVALNEKIQELIRANTRLRRTQALLQGERERFKVTLTSIGDAVMVTDTEGRITFMNPAAEALTGWSTGEAVGKPLPEVYHIVDMEIREPVDNPLTQALRKGTVVGTTNHTVLLARDGTERPIDDSGAPVRTLEGRLTGGVLVFRDVSDRRQAEQALRQSESRFRTLTTIAPVGIFLTDAAGDCVFVNDRWCGMAGLSPDEAKGRGWVRALHPEDRERVFEEWYAAAQAGHEFSSDYRFQTPDGTVTWLHGTAIELRNDGGALTGYLGAVSDITAQKLREEEREASLREKEVLLKEIHHRVKNNFQVISSLLSIQSGFIDAPQLQAIFKECQNRIYSMALVHQHLYQAEHLASIDFGAYLESLGAYLLRSYGVDTQHVQFTSTVEHVFLALDTAIPCGLLVNELISNALRHAFPDGQAGHLRVTLRQEAGGQLRLNVRDDGIGLPEGVDLQTTGSFGMRLVGLLAQQLRATLTLERHPGTSVTLTFVEPTYQAGG